MNDRTLTRFRALFVVAALWNLLGAGFGYFNPAFTFEAFFGRALTDPLVLAIYRGAWGTTLLYFFGYLVVAHDPRARWGVVLMGGVGKVGYAMTLLQMFAAGLARPVVLVVVVGDAVFALLFLGYFYAVWSSTGHPYPTSEPRPRVFSRDRARCPPVPHPHRDRCRDPQRL